MSINGRRSGLRLIAGLVCVGVGSLGGCRCGGASETGDDFIDLDPVAKDYPDAEKPVTYYSKDRHVTDESLNAFVIKALKACEVGDYDTFRQLFGITYTPPSYDDFKRVWHGVAEVRVERVFEVPKEDPAETTYYAYGVVQLRKPDAEDRLERPFVLMVYRESGEWRMGQPPPKVGQKILAMMRSEREEKAETRPGEG